MSTHTPEGPRPGTPGGAERQVPAGDGSGAGRGFDLEYLLRSRLWRRLLIAAGVLALALLTSLPLYEMLARERGIPLSELFLPRLFFYGVWGVLLEPILGIARWLRDRSQRVLVRVALLAPFTVATAAGIAALDLGLANQTRDRLVVIMRDGPESRALRGPGAPPADDRRAEGRRAEDRRSDDRRAEGGRAEGGGEGRLEGRPEGLGSRGRSRDRRGSRSAWFERGQQVRSFSRALTELWLLLAIGASIEAFLRGREGERRSAALALDSARLQAELARAQLGSLTHQLNPHFLFNSLHSVGGLVRLGDGQRALAVLSDVSSLLRLTLQQGEEQEQSLGEELAVVRSYLDIEQLRLGERLRVTIEVDEELYDAAVPSLLLLPIVENAVRHGISEREEGGEVHVAARREEDSLVVLVSDDGPGFGGASSHGTGIGLANGTARLALLYGDKARLETSRSSGGGAQVTVHLPWHTSTAGDDPAENGPARDDPAGAGEDEQ